MNYILFSKNEQFRAGAEMVRLEALKQNKQCEIIEIGNIANENNLKRFSDKPSLGYFLTNDVSISLCVKILKRTGINIINKVFLSENSQKFTLQQKARGCGINIPKSVSMPNINQIDKLDLKYPLYIKSQKQGDLVIYNKDTKEFNKNILTINNITDYYLEEAVEGEDLTLRKFYFIKGSVVGMDMTDLGDIPEWFNTVLKNISQSLGLEVFSTDIFINLHSREYFCIDINPASSFFKSKIAREEFVKNILI